MYEEEVRIFYHNLEILDDGLYLTSQFNGVAMGLDEEMLSKILGAPVVGIRSINSEKGSAEFMKLYDALDIASLKGSTKRLSRENFSCF